MGIVSTRTGNNDIWIVHPNGTGLKQITSNSGDDQQPAWTADSSAVVFSSNRDGGYGLYYQPFQAPRRCA